MIDFLQTTEGALTVACVYILVGFGWNLVYNACGYLNLATGEFYILGAILAVRLQESLGIDSVILRGIITLLAIGALAFVCEIVLLRPVGNDMLRALIITLGLALMLLQLAQQLSPEVVIRPEAFISGGSVDVGGVLIAPQDFIVWGTCLVVSLGLIYYFTRTDIGRRMRAAVDSPGAARMLGIRVRWYMTGAFTAGAMLAALAAFVVAPTQGVTYLQGDIIAITSFMAVAIGGIGKYGGGVIGAFVVALIQAYLARYWDPAAQQIVILVLFLVVLYVQAVRATPLGGLRIARLARLGVRGG
jgi:branched-chain amino acid transport system permease protein